VAIVGAGLMGRWHAHAAARAGGRVTAVVDRDVTAAARLARRYGAWHGQSVDELVITARPDVLHVCTPLASHVAIAHRAIDAGIHVLVEKPLADRPETAEHLYALAADRGVLLAPVHQYVFQDGVQRVVTSWAALGQPLYLDATFYSAGAGEGIALERNGDRIAAEILPHPLSLFEAFVPGVLTGLSWQVCRSEVGELRAWAKHQSTTLCIVVSMSARPTRAELRVAGTDGSVMLDLFHGFAVPEAAAVSRVRKAWRPIDVGLRLTGTAAINLARRATRREPAYPGLNALVRSFYQAVQAGLPGPIPANAAIAVERARAAILTAAGLDVGVVRADASDGRGE
jgi:predicted dehydrogenase